MPVKLPKGHDFFLPKTPLELARGAAVAEAVTMDDTAKELFYMGTSPAVLEFRLAEPTDDQIVMAMLKMMDACKCTKRRKAFEDVMRAPFKCSATTADPKKAARKVRIAERVRAALDGGKALLTEETIVVGNRNATRFAAALGVNNTATPSLAELRVFLSSHFASCVKQVFIWLDLPDDNVVTEVFVNGFAEELRAAAAWEHVMFVVLPPPYTDSRLPAFEVFMDHFNKASPQLKNVLWLDDSVRYDGYRFSRTLGANEFVVDGSSVYPEGTISSKGAMAAIKLLKKLCSWLDLEKKDADHRRKDHSNENSLHGVRGGGIGKNPARGAPSRGGGGGFQQRGRGFQQNFTRGRGNQSNFDRRRGSN